MKEKKDHNQGRSVIRELRSMLGSCGEAGRKKDSFSYPSSSASYFCCPGATNGCGSSRSKPKMVEAYFFDDNDSDDQSASDLSPLIRRPAAQATPSPYTHIITSYLSIAELIVLVSYLGSMIGLTVWSKDYSNSTYNFQETTIADQYNQPDKMVAYFSMIHVGIWVLVAILDRVVQWRHQALRRKGYLKFYRQMKNIHRVPFVVVSICNASLLFFVSFLYFYSIKQSSSFHNMHPVVILYVLVCAEMLFSLPCLIYYIVRATIFNCQRQSPDVIQETYSDTQSPTTSITALGFRDGEDLDELLERQADMIRYLQQHNANLGRRILELQSQTME